MALTVLALNCTLKRSNSASSTEKLLEETLQALAAEGAEGTITRISNLDIKPGVTPDEGDGDEWPKVRQKILEADIVVIGTPIWMGQPSSVAKRVLERLDAFLSETDDMSRTPLYGKVAVVAVVGNEDGAHHCHAEIFQALNDVGFSIPAGGGTYWVGEAMGDVDYKDLKKPSEKTRHTTRLMAANAVHLALQLRNSPFTGLRP